MSWLLVFGPKCKPGRMCIKSVVILKYIPRNNFFFINHLRCDNDLSTDNQNVANKLFVSGMVAWFLNPRFWNTVKFMDTTAIGGIRIWVGVNIFRLEKNITESNDRQTDDYKNNTKPTVWLKSTSQNKRWQNTSKNYHSTWNPKKKYMIISWVDRK